MGRKSKAAKACEVGARDDGAGTVVQVDQAFVLSESDIAELRAVLAELGRIGQDVFWLASPDGAEYFGRCKWADRVVRLRCVYASLNRLIKRTDDYVSAPPTGVPPLP